MGLSLSEVLGQQVLALRGEPFERVTALKLRTDT